MPLPETVTSRVFAFAFTFICLIYSHRLLCCRLYYLTLSKPMSSPTKCSIAKHLGGDAGDRTRVQHAFALKGLQQFFTTGADPPPVLSKLETY